MQTCSVCNTSSPDTATNCVNCKSDLRVLSTTAVARKNFRENPRVLSVRINVAADAFWESPRKRFRVRLSLDNWLHKNKPTLYTLVGVVNF